MNCWWKFNDQSVLRSESRNKFAIGKQSNDRQTFHCLNSFLIPQPIAFEWPRKYFIYLLFFYVHIISMIFCAFSLTNFLHYYGKQPELVQYAEMLEIFFKLFITGKICSHNNQITKNVCWTWNLVQKISILIMLMFIFHITCWMKWFSLSILF